MQPLDFKEKLKPDHVCQLIKAIYDIKQATRARFTAWKNALLQLGFVNSKVDSYLFNFRDASITCYFLVYVDDLVITRNDTSFVAFVINKLGNEFSLKDMGSLHFFLGMEVIPTSAGLFLSQHKYVYELLENIGMAAAKDVSKPLSTSTPPHLLNGIAAFEGTQYCRVIGNLQ